MGQASHTSALVFRVVKMQFIEELLLQHTMVALSFRTTNYLLVKQIDHQKIIFQKSFLSFNLKEVLGNTILKAWIYSVDSTLFWVFSSETYWPSADANLCILCSTCLLAHYISWCCNGSYAHNTATHNMRRQKWKPVQSLFQSVCWVS